MPNSNTDKAPSPWDDDPPPEIVPDGARVRVPITAMDAIQVSVAKNLKTGSYQLTTALPDATRRDVPVDPPVDPLAENKAKAAAAREEWAQRSRDAWKAPVYVPPYMQPRHAQAPHWQQPVHSMPVPQPLSRDPDEARLQAESAWEERGKRQREAWRNP